MCISNETRCRMPAARWRYCCKNVLTNDLAMICKSFWGKSFCQPILIDETVNVLPFHTSIVVGGRQNQSIFWTALLFVLCKTWSKSFLFFFQHAYLSFLYLKYKYIEGFLECFSKRYQFNANKKLKERNYEKLGCFSTYSQ